MRGGQQKHPERRPDSRRGYDMAIRVGAYHPRPGEKPADAHTCLSCEIGEPHSPQICEANQED